MRETQGDRTTESLSQESFRLMRESLCSACRNFKLALRCLVLGCMAFINGACAEQVPAECSVYMDEIGVSENCIEDDTCERSIEEERRYIEHMRAELGFCKARAKAVSGPGRDE